MELKFQTKEQSNKAQQEAFLKLSKTDRFYAFLQLIQNLKNFPTKVKKEKTNNFIIEIPE